MWMTWPVHRSCAFKTMVLMLTRLTLSRTSRLVTLSCHLMPMIDRKDLMWKHSSCLVCFRVKCPGFTVTEKTCEDDHFVHFDFHGYLDTFVVHHTSAEMAESLAGLADSGRDFPVM